MDFHTLFDDDRAVSPVIGVILMVAITVILAAVIGTFVLGLGDQVDNTTPRASFAFDKMTANSSGAYNVTITHESGDSIDASNLNVSVNGTSQAWSASGSVSAGSTFTVHNVNASPSDPKMQAWVSSGDTVRLIYSSPDSDNTATLDKRTID